MPAKINLVGGKYGEFTVIEMLYNYQNKHRTYCKCIGKNNIEVIIRADALRSGATVSSKGACKTGTPKDISNQRFGLLTTIKPTQDRASNGSIIWLCKCDCGNYIEVSAGQLTREHTMSCGCRHKSKWEVFISSFLTSLNVKFIEQKRFEECTNAQGTDMLPFDFYLPDFNIIIEYDGLQHFEPVKYWGGEEKLAIIQQNDNIKNTFCKKQNIILLRLSYTCTKDDIQSKILNILSPVTIEK